MIVLDASAACELLLRRKGEARLVELVLADGASVHAPDLMRVEVLHVLRRMMLSAAITLRRADELRADLADLPVHGYPSRPLLDRAWALRNNVTVHDALYVALAEALDATLVTADHALASAVGDHTSLRVEAVT